MLDVVADRFEIRALAGRGAMGEVHRAHDRVTGADVALKTSTAFEHSGRFVEEATALAQIDHPAVVRYVSHGILPGGRPFIAMQWIDGITLNQYLRENALAQREAVDLVARIARGLGAAHRAGVVHRDMKPSNVMLRHGELTDPVVVDFGLARRHGHAGITQTGVVVGTPGYMAPEQARGQRDMDARADVFSLGCVLYRALAGQAPFRGKDMVEVLTKILLESPRPLRDVIQQFPRELERLVSAMLAKDADLRPADGDAVAELLEAFDWRRSPGEESTSFVLGTREQRVVSIIMAKHEDPVLADSAADVMRAQGARVESLLYGGIVGVIAGVGPEQALRSARCALAVRGVLPEARIALATGRADLSGLSPVGEVIESATSLLREAGTAGVRLDDVTRGLLAERFDIEGDVLVVERPGDDAGVRKLMGKATPLVGRAQEMGMLMLFVRRVLDEGAAVMTVTAPAGYGKTRLRSELVHQLEREHPDVVVWRSRADVMGTGAPYGLARQLVSYAARIELTDSFEVQGKKVQAAVARHVGEGERDRVTAFLCEMLGCPVERRPDVDLARRDTELMREQLRRSFAALFIAQAKASPLLVVLDDLQWCDSPSLSLLDVVLEACAEQPLGVVAFARPELHTTFGELFVGRSTSELRLGPLSKRASQELVRFALGDATAEDVVARVVETASGNAFYLEELVRSVATGHGDRLPTTVVAMSQSRLERLAAELRRALRAASVFGSRFWRSGVALLTGTSEVDAAEWLAALERDELVTRVRESRFEAQGEYAFRHALVREVAYATLTEEDAAVGHGLAATWLSEHGERDAHVLADHWLESNEQVRALPHVVRIAEKARDAGDWEEALRRAEQARVLGATGDDRALVDLVTAEAENEQWTGKDVSAEAASAVENATEGGALWARAIAFASVLAIRRGDEATTERLAAIVMDAHARAPTSAEVMTAVAHVAAARMMGGLDGAPLIALFDGARSEIAAMSIHVRLRIAYARVIHGLREYGTTFEERQALRALLEESDRIAPGSAPLGMRNNLASTAMAAGRLAEAAADYRIILAHKKDKKRGGNAAFAALQLGQIAIHEGRLDEARAWEREARLLIPEKSVFADLLVWLQARIAIEAGEYEQAITLGTSLDGARQELGVAARSTAALAALALGDAARALELLSETLPSLQHLTTDDVVYVRCARAKVLSAVGRKDEARAELDAARALYSGARDAPEQNWHLQQIAKLG